MVEYGPWITENYCRQYVAYRCSQDSLSNSAAEGRFRWMKKCRDQVPVIKEFMDNFAPSTKHLIVNNQNEFSGYLASHRIQWELNELDLPGNTLRLMAGCQRLPNGNTVFCNYLGHGHIGEQPQFFEVTRDKKVVWQFEDHAHFKTINQIQVLDVKGDVTRGEILR